MATRALRSETMPPPQKGSNAKPPGTAMRPPFLNVDELAAWLGIEVVFVRRLIAERRIPFVKVGRLVRFDPEEIAAWIDGRRVAVEEQRSRPMNSRN